MITAIVVAELPALRAVDGSAPPLDGGAGGGSGTPAAPPPQPKFVLIMPHSDPGKLPKNVLSFCFPDLDQLARAPFRYDHTAEEYTFTLTPKDEVSCLGLWRLLPSPVNLLQPRPRSPVCMVTAAATASGRRGSGRASTSRRTRRLMPRPHPQRRCFSASASSRSGPTTASSASACSCCTPRDSRAGRLRCVWPASCRLRTPPQVRLSRARAHGGGGALPARSLRSPPALQASSCPSEASSRRRRSRERSTSRASASASRPSSACPTRTCRSRRC